MTLFSAKPSPATPMPEREPPERPAPALTRSRRRADLEAQKRYMDDRFGRDRPLKRGG